MRRISFPLESVSLSGGSQSHQMALSGKKEIYLGLHLEEGRKSLALREISLSSCFQRSLSVSSAISFTLIFFLLSGLLLELHNSEEKRRMWHLLVTGLNGRKRAYCHRFWGLALTKTFKTLNKNLLESERETTVLICSSNLDLTAQLS